tara:strand:+ start:1699 stop:1929 length:231 start_codon:yes stop_codon:yes gene_type:complete
MSNVVTNSNRKEYLSSKTWMFKSGFLAAEDMKSDKGRDTYPCQLNIGAREKNEWNAGYEAARNNSFTAVGQSACAL